MELVPILGFALIFNEKCMIALQLQRVRTLVGKWASLVATIAWAVLCKWALAPTPRLEFNIQRAVKGQWLIYADSHTVSAAYNAAMQQPTIGEIDLCSRVFGSLLYRCCTCTIIIVHWAKIPRKELKKIELREFKGTQEAIIKEIGNFDIQPHMQWAWQNDNIL